jgi:hypothetical protein
MQKKTKIRNGYAVAAKSRRNAGPMVHKGAKRERFQMDDFVEEKSMKSYLVEIGVIIDTGESADCEVESKYVMAENPILIEQSLQNYYDLFRHFYNVIQFQILSFAEAEIPMGCFFINTNGSEEKKTC